LLLFSIEPFIARLLQIKKARAKLRVGLGFSNPTITNLFVHLFSYTWNWNLELNRNHVWKSPIDICLLNVLSFMQNMRGVPMQAYCMKCRKKVDIKNPQQITMKN